MTIPIQCEICGQETTHADSVSDPTKRGYNLNECGYRYQALCWVHAADRRLINTSRIVPVLIFAGIGYIDAGHASGDCICEICRRPFRNHPRVEYMNKLCDDALVKL